MINPVEVTQGHSPIILGQPHTGTYIPQEISAKLNARGRKLDDTDWHIHQLYDGLLPDATVVRACFHRYVIDPNRDPSGVSLYPGQNTTALVPLTDFDGHNLWEEAPTEADIQSRLRDFHAPYHAALEAELNRVNAIYGFAILYDCHSIRSHVPNLFDGPLPHFNIGTNNGVTCDPRIEHCVKDICEAVPPYKCVLNGRFKGGWTTRHYGRPEQGWHAIQMELAQNTYLAAESPPWVFDDEKAAQIRIPLKNILDALNALAPKIGGYS